MSDYAAKEAGDQEATIEELKAEQELMQEKAERKRLETLWWAAVIIWAGLIFIADYVEILPEIREAGVWSWIFLGAGVFGLIGALIRVMSNWRLQNSKTSFHVALKGEATRHEGTKRSLYPFFFTA